MAPIGILSDLGDSSENERHRRSGCDSFGIRHEIEFGIKDRLQLTFCLPYSNPKDSPDVSRTSFEDVEVGAIYNLSNPGRRAGLRTLHNGLLGLLISIKSTVALIPA